MCHSLGIVVGIVKDKRAKYTTDVAYKVTIQTDPENKLTLFKLPKHINKIKDYFEKRGENYEDYIAGWKNKSSI